MNIVQYHHSCEVSSSKICQFFAEFHVSQSCETTMSTRCAAFAVMTAKRVRGSVSEAVLLPTEEGCVRAIPFERDTFYHSMDSWIRPTSRRPIAPMTGEDRRNILIIDNDSCLNATAQESGIAGPRLRLCQWHVPESLPYTHVWLERWEYLPAAPPLPAVLFVEAAAIVRRVS